VDVVLGVSMGSTAVRMVLVEGENADGVIVDEDNFRITAPTPATSSAPGQVLSAILGTREGATEGGYRLTSTGVAWTDPAEAAVLRDALAAYKIQNVMLVSAFLAAAALAQTVGHAIGYRHTTMLLIDPEYATVGIVDSDDGSITGVRREPLQLSRHGADTVAQLAAMIASVNTPESRPEGVFLVGRGIDIAALKPALETVTPLRVSASEEPEMALARGAALASASAPLFVSSTNALAYAQDPGTGEVDQYLSAEYLSAAEVSGSEPIAYSGVPDDDADADTVVIHAVTNGGRDQTRQRRRPVLLISSVLAVIFISAVLALEVALAINIRTTVALQPSPEQNLIVPTQQAPAPAPPLQAPAANHQLAPVSQPVPNIVARPPAAPVPALPAPAAPAPALPGPAAPAPALPAPAAAPAPVPVPVAPVPIPLPVPAAAAPLPVPNMQPPVNMPAPPVHVPNPPLQVPTAPLQPPLPKPPVQLPTPQPPVQLPTPKPLVQLPTPKPPVQLPTPQPPVQLPTPKPPVQLPTPKPPVQLPTPQPPVQLPTPKPPVQLRNPQPPVQLPVPRAPTAPIIPSPVAPRVPLYR
jgi:hypothetical protein